MKTLLALVTSVVALGQAGPQSFAGTWTAEHAGQTFVRLELQVTGNAIGGRISLGDVEVDKTGQVKTAKAAPTASTPLLDIAQKDGLLTFARKDGRDTDHFELKLIDATTAELTLVLTEDMRKELADEGISDFKPFRLKKLARN